MFSTITPLLPPERQWSHCHPGRWHSRTAILLNHLPPVPMSRLQAWQRKSKGGTLSLPLPRAELLHRHAPTFREQRATMPIITSMDRRLMMKRRCIARGAHLVLAHCRGLDQSDGSTNNRILPVLGGSWRATSCRRLMRLRQPRIFPTVDLVLAYEVLVVKLPRCWWCCCWCFSWECCCHTRRQMRLRQPRIFSTVELATWLLPLNNALLSVHFTRHS